MHPNPNLRLYRLTNINELHNGLQYHDGIVEDPLSFQPTGNCSAGGMYFFDETQLHLYNKYVENAYWIREVQLLPDSRVYAETDKYKTDKFVLKPRKLFDFNDLLNYVNLQYLSKKQLHEVMIIAANKDSMPVIKGLLIYGIDIHANNDQALRCAARYGNSSVVELLLETGSACFNANRNEALRFASKNGHSSVVNLLIKAGADVHANEDEALRNSSKRGHAAVVELLLKAGANVHANNDEALLEASSNGHDRVVELLLDGQFYTLSIKSRALRRSVTYGSVYRQLVKAGARIDI